MKLLEKLTDRLLEVIVGAFAGLCSFFAAKAYHDVSGPFLANVLPAFSNETLLSACSIALLIIVLLAIALIAQHWQHREPTARQKEKEFAARFEKFDEKRCLYIHKTKPGLFCPKCYSEYKESPVAVTPERWTCPVCQKTYENPDYQKPPNPQPRGRGSDWLKL